MNKSLEPSALLPLRYNRTFFAFFILGNYAEVALRPASLLAMIGYFSLVSLTSLSEVDNRADIQDVIYLDFGTKRYISLAYGLIRITG